MTKRLHTGVWPSGFWERLMKEQASYLYLNLSWDAISYPFSHKTTIALNHFLNKSDKSIDRSKRFERGETQTFWNFRVTVKRGQWAEAVSAKDLGAAQRPWMLTDFWFPEMHSVGLFLFFIQILNLWSSAWSLDFCIGNFCIFLFRAVGKVAEILAVA